MERSNLAAVQEAHARTHPHDEALVDGALRLTHSQFAQRIAQTAKHLRTLGAGPGVLVGVALGDHATHVIIMLALARIGAVLLPLDHRWTPGERERVATHFGAALALVEPCQAISGTPCVEVSEKWPDTVSQCAADPVMAPGGDAPLLVSLSSGTTGRPKGPRITHAQFLARFRTHWIDLGFVAQDCFVCATPLYFGAGRTFVWSTLYAGGKVVLAPPPFDPPALLDTLAREHATTLFLVPTQLRRLLAEHAGVDNSNYRERAAQVREEYQNKANDDAAALRARLSRTPGDPAFDFYQSLLARIRANTPLTNAASCPPRSPKPM